MKFKLWLESQSCSGGYGPVYHGSRHDLTSFDLKRSNYGGTIYFTSNPQFADEFATDRSGASDAHNGFIYTACLNISKTFDPTNPTMRKELKPILVNNIKRNVVDPTTGVKFMIYPNLHKSLEEAVNWYLWRIENGSWRIIESKSVLDYIKSRGYDSIKTVERGAANIAVFDPSRISIIDKKPVSV